MELSPIQKLGKKLKDEVIDIDDDAARWRALSKAFPERDTFVKILGQERYWTVHSLKQQGLRPKAIAEAMGIRPDQVSRELSGGEKTAPTPPEKNEEVDLADE